ncbi:hypothetical protein M413DRAFT_32912 [Hebeloma cylindrosporum]|uniref:Fungal-type protein kinase domain-containing protein n=1 Tax=Hebeloma cylindrosporum TaxID=76867 RepID=A0A0C3BDP8_HEBCY|nr:hypothetical protein M413DRAFT_32912 [Hebeloma cylindrosporum h7]
MAVDILQAIILETSVTHEPQHDIESFIYVLAYSVASKAILHSGDLDTNTRKELLSLFYSNFGRMTFREIWNSKRGRGPFTVRLDVPDIMSVPMVRLMDVLETFLLDFRMDGNKARQGKPTTHESFLSALDKAIGMMV